MVLHNHSGIITTPYLSSAPLSYIPLLYTQYTVDVYILIPQNTITRYYYVTSIKIYVPFVEKGSNEKASEKYIISNEFEKRKCKYWEMFQSAVKCVHRWCLSDWPLTELTFGLNICNCDVRNCECDATLHLVHMTRQLEINVSSIWGIETFSQFIEHQWRLCSPIISPINVTQKYLPVLKMDLTLFLTTWYPKYLQLQKH